MSAGNGGTERKEAAGAGWSLTAFVLRNTRFIVEYPGVRVVLLASEFENKSFVGALWLLPTRDSERALLMWSSTAWSYCRHQCAHGRGDEDGKRQL